jgi:hypothetical protein
MNFQVSDKVVYVDDSPPKFPLHHWDCPNGIPVLGQVYTVRGLNIASDGLLGLKLVGLLCLMAKTGREVGFLASRFRKLEEVQLIARVLKSQTKPNKQPICPQP